MTSWKWGANNPPERPGSRSSELPTDTQGWRQLLNPRDGGKFQTMGNVHHGLFTVIARHSTQNGCSNLSGYLPLSIYRHELTKDCKVTSVQSMKMYRGRKGRAPPILKLGTRCEWNFTSRTFYCRKKTRKPINMRLGEPQRMSARLEEKNLLWISAPNRWDRGLSFKVHKYNA